MAWPIMLTKAQTARLIEALREYQETLPGERVELTWALDVVLSMWDRGIAWEDHEAVVVKAILDEMFSTYLPDWYDEQLERAYHKLYGAWPIEPPWFVKKHQLPRE